MIGVLEHFVSGASLRLDDPFTLDVLSGYLRQWLDIAGLEASEADMLGMLENFVRGMRDDFAAVERAVTMIQKSVPN